LFAKARTAEQISEMSLKEIDALINTCTFHERKAEQIHTIANRIVEDFDGDLPGEIDMLLSFTGVGPKCANLVLGIACGQPYISVDIHVHRVTNRWGYVKASTPEKTMAVLESKLLKEYWIDVNRLLVPFGKHICTSERPHCSTCPLLEMCQQAGVKDTR
jgi:endonuclease-3